MFTNNDYYYYRKLFTEQFCDYVIEKGLSQQKIQGMIGQDGRPVYDKKVRESTIVWLQDKNILEPIKELMHNANQKANWNFELDLNLDLKTQFTMYTKKQFYDFHRDSFKSNRNRKLSFSLNLSNPSDYTGGEFLFKFHDKPKKDRIYEMKEISEKGSCLVFPSFQCHKVAPVKKGIRYSLVVWLTGPNWR